MSTKIFVQPVTRTPNLNVIAPQGRLSRDRGYLGSYDFMYKALVLLCHKSLTACVTLAAGTSGEFAGNRAGDDDADRGDGVCHMAFRPERGIRGVDNRREGEVLR